MLVLGMDPIAGEPHGYFDGWRGDGGGQDEGDRAAATEVDAVPDHEVLVQDREVGGLGGPEEELHRRRAGDRSTGALRDVAQGDLPVDEVLTPAIGQAASAGGILATGVVEGRRVDLGVGRSIRVRDIHEVALRVLAVEPDGDPRNTPDRDLQHVGR